MLQFAAENPPNIDTAPDVSVTPQLAHLLDRNRTSVPYPRDMCIHALFEARAQETPDAIALMFEDSALTYGELNGRASRLACYLRGLGVGPEVVVAVALERSIEMIVALLAVLKAGGAYLPLDPEAPPARLTFVLNDAVVAVIVTQEQRAELLPRHPAPVVCVDRDWPVIALESDAPLVSGATAESLAYVLFTSGSTGTPKGVLVEHRAVTRLVCNTDYARLAPDETLLQMAPLAFDASTFEIWGALLNGARLAIMPPGTPAPCEIGDAIARHGVTTLWLTAGLFHQMAEGHMDALRGLRQLLAGGDVLAIPHASRVVQGLPGCRLINGYGPTECTTFACCCPVDAGALAAPSLPIGRPIANTRAYILDEAGLPVADGAEGELFIGGDGVARGYLNRPDLTAERFLPDPFQAAPGGRMYRTGDVARYLPDGRIEFLGRRDNQVKIRGFRIELDEIAAALLQHPAISACFVAAQGEGPDSKRLAATLVLRGSAQTAPQPPNLGESCCAAHLVPVQVEAAPPAAFTQILRPAPQLTTLELREFLRLKLPEYMVPALFSTLPALPLTPNGKVDSAALARCDTNRLPSGVAYVAPGSAMEQRVAAVWQEVLEVEQVGLNENFFDIGGDSLRMTRMHWKLQQAAGMQFSITALFQFPTVKAFAKYLHDHHVHANEVKAAGPPAGAGTADDRASKQRAAMARWKQIANGGRQHG